MRPRAGAGIGLRAPHYAELLERLPTLALVELHSENHFGLGGLPLQVLDEVRSHYHLSLHGVGLSLGSADELNRDHLRRLRTLVDRVQPTLVSEHLSWNAIGGEHLRDLLPLPHTDGAIELLVSRIHQVQDALRQPLLVENVSSYLRFTDDRYTEWEFVGAIARRAGCRLLLDINNIYVNACNHAFPAEDYLSALDSELIGEIHLAGHTRRQTDSGEVLLDTHDAPVCTAVWALYLQALMRFGPKPTVIEWDSRLPTLDLLLGEADQAQRLLDSASTLPS